MSDSLSDADKIRNKRLAKLGMQAQSQSGNSGEGSGAVPSAPDGAGKAVVENTIGHDEKENAKSKINLSTQQSGSKATPNSISQVGIPSIDGPRINITSVIGRPVTPAKRDHSSSTTGSPGQRSAESVEEWENRVLGGIFGLTLNPKTRHDSHGRPLRYLPGVQSDLEEQGEVVRLSTGVLDQAIVEAASNLEKMTPLDYLLACWKRVSRLFRSFKGAAAADAKYGIIKEARRLCMSYCIFAVTMPDMFGQEVPETNPLVPHMLVDPEDDRGVCHEFFAEAISRFQEDDMAQKALVGAVEDLSRQLAQMTMNANYKPYVLALRNAVQYPPLINAIVQSPYFLPPLVRAESLEQGTLLGPFFAISPLQNQVPLTYFSSPKTRDRAFILNSQRALRLTLQTHQTDLLDIVNPIIKNGKIARERLLDWFAICVNTNHKRRALHPDPKTISSDGFMVNVTACLDQLCEPFMTATFAKIDKIDVDYLRRDPRVDIKEETKLNADQHASDAFYRQRMGGDSNFISEVFFVTLAAHQYGTEATSARLNSLEKELKDMEKRLEELELERHKFVNDSHSLRMFDAGMKKFKDQFDSGLSYKHAVQGLLLDDLCQARSMQFMRYVIVWLLRLVAPHQDFPTGPLRLPLPEKAPEVFKCLPEYFLEVVISNFKFIMRNMPQIITSTQADELVMLCITFLQSSEYIKNPYLKSGLITILSHGVWPVYNRSKGILGDLLFSLPFATQYLLHGLMKFYIEIETTGAHNQFFEKFNTRYEIFQIIKCIWPNPVYREQLSTESQVNVDFFVRFVNLLLNDVTFVLDESLTAFIEIHGIAEELKHSPDMDQALRQEKEEHLGAAKGKAKSYMQLTNESVAMLKLFTEALADAFTMPEIVQRLADMLDYNLDAMVGARSSQLIVENPGEYGFNPKSLLAELVDIYSNLRDKESFVIAVARDGRSYKPAIFEKATVILKKWALKSPEAIAAWVALLQKFKKAKEVDDQAEEDLGEIPDEFLDPLMYDLMKDPVILPTSKISIDRSTIRSHLLSDPNDPFNRSPLKIEDVIPDTDLLARIEAFKAERKGKKLAEAGGVMDIQPDGNFS